MRIIFDRKFRKKYKKLNLKIKTKFEERFELFKSNPINVLLNLHKLSGEYNGSWSINITGDYRAIFDKQDDEIIIFINIGTHSELFG